MPDRIESFVASMAIRPTDRVLEIGCGHGIAATLVCQQLKTGRYVAVDRSLKMIAAAEKRNRTFVAVGLARFVQSTLEHLDLGEERFDKVFAMRVRLFHDQPELARKLAERWLAADGLLFVQYDEPA